MRTYLVEWPSSKLEALRRAARRVTIPEVPFGSGWDHGCDPAFLRAFCAYWSDGYDADAAVEELNRYPQIVTEIEDIDIHAVHVVGEAQGRRPLLLAHGWPGSTYEFWQTIEPLAYPSRHGGRAEDAFDVVVPSLPGFGFSGKPRAPVGARTTARLFHTLMSERLGYPRYLAQGGDWGSAVAAWLALEAPEAVRSIHLNYLLVQPHATPETDEERSFQKARDATQQKLGAYALLQGTRPLSLAYAMESNPVAQAAWILERFHDWSDRRERTFSEIFTPQRLLTNIMIYLMNDAFTSTAYYYAAAGLEEVRQMPEGRKVEVPTAFTTYRDPRMPNPPRTWVERGYNLARWADQPKGGHFAAMEAPEAFVADLQAWGREIG